MSDNEDRTPTLHSLLGELRADVKRHFSHCGDPGIDTSDDQGYIVDGMEALGAMAMRLTAALGRANRALDAIIARDEKGPAWEPRDVFGDPSDIDISNSDDLRRHGAWTAYQYAAKIARAARTQPEGSND